MRHASGHQGENKRQWKRKKQEQMYKILISSSIKYVKFRTFHLVVVQNNNKEMYKKMFCLTIFKVVLFFCLIFLPFSLTVTI